MKSLKSEKGSFTVEATVVFVMTFMVLIFFLFVGVVMYQHVHFQSATNRVASRGAMIFTTRTTDMETGYKSSESFWNCDPYRYLFDGIGNYKGTVESKIKSKLASTVGVENVIRANEGDSANARVSLGMFSRKVEVTGSRSFNVPFSSMFDVENSFFNLDVNSMAYITDMPETIRNVDFAVDLIKRNDKASNAISKVGELKDKVLGFIDKIR